MQQDQETQLTPLALLCLGIFYTTLGVAAVAGVADYAANSFGFHVSYLQCFATLFVIRFAR